MDDQPDLRKHRILILETKLEILNRLSTGESGAALAKHYGVSKSTVSEIKRKGDMLLEYASNLRVEDGLKKRKTLRTASNTALEEAMYSWYKQRKDAGDPVSGPLICEKALEINHQLGGSREFKASSGWLKNFKTRHNIKMEDLIIGDITARVARNKIKELYRDQSGSETQCSDSQIQQQRINSDSEMDSQLSSDTVSFPIITKTPEQEINDAVSSILQSPEDQNGDIDDHEYTVSFPTVTTELSPSDQENSNLVEDEYTNSSPTTLHSPDQENLVTDEDSQPEVVHLPDEEYSDTRKDRNNTSELPEHRYSDAVEEAPIVSYPSIETVLDSPDQRNSFADEGMCMDSYPVTSILPDQEISDAVEDIYMAPYPLIKTDLHSPDMKNFHAAEGVCVDSYPVTSILPDLDHSDAINRNNRVPIKIEVKQEPPDVIDDDPVMTEEDPGPSDKEVLVALDTVVDWLERQPDRTACHLSTLKSIRDFATYKESLRSLPPGANAVIP